MLRRGCSLTAQLSVQDVSSAGRLRDRIAQVAFHEWQRAADSRKCRYLEVRQEQLRMLAEEVDLHSLVVLLVVVVVRRSLPAVVHHSLAVVVVVRPIKCVSIRLSDFELEQRMMDEHSQSSQRRKAVDHTIGEEHCKIAVQDMNPALVVEAQVSRRTIDYIVLEVVHIELGVVHIAPDLVVAIVLDMEVVPQRLLLLVARREAWFGSRTAQVVEM